jgi:hypothetical protein
MSKFEVTIQEPNDLVWNKRRKDLNLNFKLNQVHMPKTIVDTRWGYRRDIVAATVTLGVSHGSLVNRIFRGEPHPYQVSLSDIRVVMTFMHVLIGELVCQAMTGWISDLECLLPDARESQQLCLVLSGIKWPRHLRDLALESHAQYWRPPSMATRGILSRGMMMN